MRLAAAILFLLAVVAGAGAASALGFEKPPVVVGPASTLRFKKPLVVVGPASALGFKKPPAVDVVMPVDPHGPILGRFAVLVYSLSRNARLTYSGVSGVEQHPDKGGVRYQMVLTATDAGGGTYTYRAVVWGIPKTEQWMLLQFKRIY